jgi:hypothetical protein
MANPINLDALILREDFEVSASTSTSAVRNTIAIQNLETRDFFYATLRKPDFQRETSDWSARKTCDLIKSFLDEDLIPAIILWNSGANNFVIDGAHRLSALIAWVNDDYGDKQISRDFFEGRISDEQIEAADHARKLIRKTVGTYEDHKLAISNPEKVRPEIVTQAQRLARLALQLQWVNGDATKAEESFFKINQQAAPIDATELKLLRSRKLPNAMAARAIIHSGTGHKYWAKFSPEIQTDIEATAKAINGSMFVPKLTTPIKTLDLPIAGRGYSAQTLPLVFELVNLANDSNAPKVRKRKPSSSPNSAGELAPDGDGTTTLRFLRNTKSIVDRISGTHPSSLGLHPAIYFYSATGRYQPTAFLAVVELVKELDRDNLFKEFVQCRPAYESFLLENKIFINQVTVKFGSGLKGFAQLKKLFRFLLDEFRARKDGATIVQDLAKTPEFSYLQPAEKPQPKTTSDFDPETKSAAFLRDALSNALRCKICGGLIHRNSITIDHIERKSEGGIGEVTNAQLAHPYCNTTVKQ